MLLANRCRVKRVWLGCELKSWQMSWTVGCKWDGRTGERRDGRTCDVIITPHGAVAQHVVRCITPLHSEFEGATEAARLLVDISDLQDFDRALHIGRSGAILRTDGATGATVAWGAVRRCWRLRGRINANTNANACCRGPARGVP